MNKNSFYILHIHTNPILITKPSKKDRAREWICCIYHLPSINQENEEIKYILEKKPKRKIERKKINLNFILKKVHYSIQYQLKLVKLQIEEKSKGKDNKQANKQMSRESRSSKTVHWSRPISSAIRLRFFEVRPPKIDAREHFLWNPNQWTVLNERNKHTPKCNKKNDETFID